MWKAETLLPGLDRYTRFAPTMVIIRRAGGASQHRRARIRFDEWRLSGPLLSRGELCGRESSCREASDVAFRGKEESPRHGTPSVENRNNEVTMPGVSR